MIEKASPSQEFYPTSRRTRDTEALAESIAKHNAKNNTPAEHVMIEWALQKGITFVDRLLGTSTYRSLPDEEKEQLRSIAARAIGEKWLKDLGFDKAASSRRDRDYPGWSPGLSYSS